MFTIICIRMNIYYVLLSYKPVSVFVEIVAYTIYQKRKNEVTSATRYAGEEPTGM